MYDHDRRLDWYKVLVRNDTVVGSLVTLVHVPFMLAFISLTVVGALSSGVVDLTALGLSVAVVALLLYAEHMLDDTIGVGKPWGTVFSDRALFAMADVLFLAAGVVGLAASIWFASPVPLVGVLLGVVLTTFYGLEVWRFHTVLFGSLGMGAIPIFSYLAQAQVTGTSPSAPVALSLLVFGSTYGYVMLGLYEHTKTDDYRLSWKLLLLQFVMLYSLAALWLLTKGG